MVDTLEITAGTEWHAVQFYESDDQLCRVVVQHLARAVLAGGVAIAIATESHRRAFVAGLRAAGVDTGRAIADGTVVLLDASGTLAGFVRDGRIDPGAFLEWPGALVRGAESRGGPLHLYGEMVSLLWEAGDIPGAIELEKLWNELGDQLPFSLLCGYPSSSLSDPRHGHALDRVCSLHSAALPSRSLPGDSVVEASLPFPAERDGPGAARQFIDHVLWDWGYDRALVEDARLVISELTTNVVLHAGSPFRVGVRIEGDDLRLSVCDESLRRPHVLAPRPDEPHGRGLRVVAAVADDWGVVVTADGKTVWAKLRCVGVGAASTPRRPPRL